MNRFQKFSQDDSDRLYLISVQTALKLWQERKLFKIFHFFEQTKMHEIWYGNYF